MTQSLNAILTITRVLSVVGLLFIVLTLIQRERFERLMLARATKLSPPNPKQHFWIAVVVAFLLFGCLALFVDRFTGLPVPLSFRLLISAAGFVFVTGMAAVGFFLIPRWHARDPKRAARLGFVLLAIGGVLLLTGFYLDRFWLIH